MLDRILDKGLVIAGDIKVSITNIELLTVQIRLIICSIEKAEQIGINWWRFDPNLTQQAPPTAQIKEPQEENTETPEPAAPAQTRQPGIPANAGGTGSTPSRPRRQTNAAKKSGGRTRP